MFNRISHVYGAIPNQILAMGLLMAGIVGMLTTVTPVTLAEENATMPSIEGFPEVNDAVNNQSIQEKVNYGNRFIWKERRKNESSEQQTKNQEAFEDKLKQRELKPLPSNSATITRKLKPKDEPNIVIGE